MNTPTMPIQINIVRSDDRHWWELLWQQHDEVRVIARGFALTQQQAKEVAVFEMERVAGVEPAFSAWKADALPLNYTREISAER